MSEGGGGKSMFNGCRADARQEKQVAKKVPKGTSEYQAAWIIETDSEQVQFFTLVS